MFHTIRNSLGLSPTKRNIGIQDDHTLYASSPPRSNHDLADLSDEPSIWGRLDVVSKSGVVKSGLNLLERDYTIGRSTDNDVRLCELKVSRHACRIHFLKPDMARLELLGTNQVTLNDAIIMPLPDADEPVSVLLHSGDLIELSKYRFRFSYSSHLQKEKLSSSSSSTGRRPVYVPTSPSEKGRQSLQGLSTPGGKRRRIRTSLVRAADVDTPTKARETFARLDALDSEPQKAQYTNSQPRLPFVQLTPASSLVNFSVATSSPLQQRIPLGIDTLTMKEENVNIFKHSLGLMQDRHEADEICHEEEVQDDLVVIDEEDEVADEEPDYDQEQQSDDAPAEERSNSTQDDVARKERRRSSFLGRAWPFTSPQGFYSAERQEEQPVTPQRPSGEILVGEEEQVLDESEDEQEADKSELLSPRLPRSLSSPGRLGSPSFHVPSSRKVSLRTKTLIRSSAALVERMAATESEFSIFTSAMGESARPGSPSETPEEAQEEEDEDCQEDEDEVNASLSLVEEVDEEEPEMHQQSVPVPDSPEDLLQESRSTPPFMPEEATDQTWSSPKAHENHHLPSLPANSSRSSKRLSMPTFFGRRRSLFGLGIFPKPHTSNEAEDLVGKVEQIFGQGDERGTSHESAADGASVQDSENQSMLTVASCENLKGPAREALKYLLSNKAKAASPLIGSDGGDESQANTSTGSGAGLRSLMLGRQEPMLLQRVKSSRRSSLILAPSTPAMDRMRSVSPQARQAATPDLTFLRHVFALPKEEADTDPQLQALRYLFVEHEETLSRVDEENHEDVCDGEALALLLATPAAQRTLVNAASRVARLTPKESAQQAAATIETLPAAVLHSASPDVMSPIQAQAGRRRTDHPASGSEENNNSLNLEQTPTYKKTRRGCRGGRRRSKSFSPNVDLGSFDAPPSSMDAVLADGAQQEPCNPVDESRQQSHQRGNHDIGPLAPSSPPSSPVKGRSLRASKTGKADFSASATPLHHRSGSIRVHEDLTAEPTTSSKTPVRVGETRGEENAVRSDAAESQWPRRQQSDGNSLVGSSPAKFTRSRSVRRQVETEHHDSEQATGAELIEDQTAKSTRAGGGYGRRVLESSKHGEPKLQEVVTSPSKPVARKTATRGRGRKARADTEPEEAETDPVGTVPTPTSGSTAPTTRSRRGAVRDVAPLESIVAVTPAAAPARATRSQKTKSSRAPPLRPRRRGEATTEEEQEEEEREGEGEEQHDEDADESEEEEENEPEPFRRNTRSSPVKRRGPTTRDVQSSPVKKTTTTTTTITRSRRGGAASTTKGNDAKENVEEASHEPKESNGIVTRGTRRRGAVVAKVGTTTGSEAEELPLVAPRATRSSSRGTRRV